MGKSAEVVIVGSGHGGVSTAIQLRQAGFAGSILMVSADPDLPYERPPLSKDYLAGDKGFGAILARPESFWAERGIELLLGEEVIAVKPERGRLACGSGLEIAYGKLIWAAGGRALQLPCHGAGLTGVHSIRCRADVDQLRAELPVARRVVVIGGGYIGLEAAAVLNKLDKPVTVLEAADRLLARVAGEPIGQFLRSVHEGRGVKVETGVTVTRLLGEARVTGLALQDGRELEADLVIVGIGLEPCARALLDAGAKGGDGVQVDEYCRASLPSIWAVGDCALHHNRFGPDRPVRIESVQNAADMGKVAALDIAGQARPYDVVPWFWSNQYDLRLQTVGLNHDHDEQLLRGEPASGSFSVIYRRKGRVIALDCVNNVKDYVAGRTLVERSTSVEAARLLDTSQPLKSLLS